MGLHAAAVIVEVVGVEGREVFGVVGTVGDHVFVLELAVFGRLDADQEGAGACDLLGDLGHP